jgi:septal ring factor EnvC (AmiA/AmiB activator)
MRASIDAQIKAMKERTFAAIRAQMAEDEKAHEAFTKDLAKWEAEEAVRAQEKRARKTQESKGWIREAKSKAETAAAERAAEMEATRAENARALGGAADEEFRRAVEELAREEQAKGHSTRMLYRMVHKVTNPPLMSGGGR